MSTLNPVVQCACYAWTKIILAAKDVKLIDIKRWVKTNQIMQQRHYQIHNKIIQRAYQSEIFVQFVDFKIPYKNLREKNGIMKFMLIHTTKILFADERHLLSWRDLLLYM